MVARWDTGLCGPGLSDTWTWCCDCDEKKTP